MGRKAAKSDRASSINKTSESTTDKKKPTKKLKKSIAANETDLERLGGDIDSLKNMKEQKNSKETDKKINNLMSELLSLVGDPLKSETNENNKKTEKSVIPNSQIFTENPEKTINCDDSVMEDSTSTPYKQLENIKGRNSPEILSSSGPSPFSKWLNTRTDNISDYKENNSKVLNPFHCIKAESSTLFKNFTSHKETEKLLYKSFVLQNLHKYLSSSEESVCELGVSSTNKSNKIKRKISTRRNKKNYRQSKSNKRIAGQRGRKRRIESECDIEIIHSKLNSLSCSARNNTPEVEIGIESLDWDEPFVLDDTTDKCSFDVEIIEPATEKTNNVSKRKKSVKSQEINIDSSVSRKSVESKSGAKEKNWECPICFEPSFGQEIVTTLCGHVFCKKCIEKYNSSKERTCPSCRTDLTNKPLITLFNL